MNPNTRNTFFIILAAAVTAIVLPLIPIVNLLDYPFRLLLTIVHELGHGVAALITGGGFRNFVISPDGSGVAYTAGGWRLVIIPAGYLGVAIFSAVLFRLGGNLQASRRALGIIGVAMIALSLIFGRPGAFNIQAIVSSVLGMVFGVIFGALFLKIALQANANIITFFIHFIAVKAGLTAFSDIFIVIGLAGQPGVRTDAQSLAELTHIPAIIWGGVWVIFAAAVIGAAVWQRGKNGFTKVQQSG